MRGFPIFIAALILVSVGCSSEPSLTEPASPALRVPRWVPLESGSKASLRGLSVVDRSVGWASGSEGTVLRTLDGGLSWQNLVVVGGGDLDLRDVEAFDSETAVLMTAGKPARLYRTQDGGKSFELAYESSYEDAFFDAMDFWDSKRGLAFSDPVEGRFLILVTEDGGQSWGEVDSTALPFPRDGEAGFAASGSNVAVGPHGHAWIGTGGSASRVLRSSDYGRSWNEAELPLAQGVASAGAFSIAFRDALHGLAAGGDYLQPDLPTGTMARTEDGGKTWSLAEVPPPSGHRASVIHVSDQGATIWISVGRGGSDFSRDDGRSWGRFSEVGYYVLSRGADGALWAAGADGRVARLEW